MIHSIGQRKLLRQSKDYVKGAEFNALLPYKIKIGGIKMKKFLITICIFFSLSICAFAASSGKAATVVLNGEELAFDVAPEIVNGSTMVPMRKIFESLGATVDWDQETKTVTAVKELITIKVTINDTRYYVNNVPFDMDEAGYIKNGNTLVPVRAISESIGACVDWDNKNKAVIINTKPQQHLKIELSERSGDYYGEVFEGKANGYGVVVLNDSEDLDICGIVGSFENGKLIKGRVAYTSNDYYVGELDGLIRNGYGTYYLETGAYYIGEWKNGGFSGKGEYHYDNGRYVVGDFDNRSFVVNENLSVYDENGKLISSVSDRKWRFWLANAEITGLLYEGKFYSDCTIKYSDGSKYEGEVFANLKHGEGTMEYADGHIVSGEWEKDVLVKTNSEKYTVIDEFTGEYRDGKPYEGSGKYRFSNGSWFEGTWKNGYWYDGQGKRYYSNGSWFEGTWKNGSRHDGQGEVYYSDGSWFEGTWKNGYWYNGYGKNVDDGGYYVGEYSQGYRHGKCTYYRDDGSYWVGNCHYGKYTTGTWYHLKTYKPIVSADNTNKEEKETEESASEESTSEESTSEESTSEESTSEESTSEESTSEESTSEEITSEEES